MKDKIRDYIGRHGHLKLGAEKFNSSNLILGIQGFFIFPQCGYNKIVLCDSDPIIVLQKLSGYNSIYVIMCSKGIAWIAANFIELDKGDKLPVGL